MVKPLFPDVIVNGEVIPSARIAAEAQNHSAPKGKPGIAWRKAADAEAIRTLLLQEALNRDIRPDRQEVGPGRFETDEEALIRGLLETSVDVTPPSDFAIHAEWQKDPARFKSPPLWEVSHILCSCDPRDDEARTKAQKRANSVLAIALRDPKAFPTLAARESDCGSKSAGGTLGQLGPGDTVPEFEAALKILAEFEISPEPVLTRHGYHVIRLDALAEGQVLPFDAVRSKISEAMEKASWARQARSFVDQLVEAADIKGVKLGAVSTAKAS